MAGFDNVREMTFDKLTPERQRKIASMGGKASQAAAKRRKTMREIFQQIGSLEVTDEALKKKMQKLGIPDEDITWQVALAVSTILNAIKKGDVKTIEFVLQMLDDGKKKSENPFEEMMKMAK